MTLCIPGVLAVGWLLAAACPDDAVRKEKEELVGTWRFVSMRADGHEAPALAIEEFRFTFTAESITQTKTQKSPGTTGEYKLDPSKSPKWIDIPGDTGSEKGVILGLYTLDGDTLTVCFLTTGRDRPNGEQRRPKKLDGGAGHMLITLKRQKP
jgi:uncharacterized protein (TIGR03067 family)